jgi:serine/threonine protein kinase
VDTRADIWAFGCLLHEMLTGQPAFQGASSAEVMATVLRDDVDWSRLPPETPPALRRLLRRCLRRELRERLQDIGDARIELSELGRDEPDGPAPPSPGRGLPRAVWPWLLGAAALSLLVGA